MNLRHLPHVRQRGGGLGIGPDRVAQLAALVYQLTSWEAWTRSVLSAFWQIARCAHAPLHFRLDLMILMPLHGLWLGTHLGENAFGCLCFQEVIQAGTALIADWMTSACDSFMASGFVLPAVLNVRHWTMNAL